MASETEIANAALDKLGEPPLTSFDDESRGARLAKRTYADLRDALLREYPWNFAMHRAELAADEDGPEWGYTYRYPLPADFLRQIEIYNPNAAEWRMEGGAILTDLGAPLQLRYIRRITDVNAMDFDFREALSARLAMEWAQALTQDGSTVERMAALYEAKLRTARAADGHEEEPRALETTTFIDARW